MRPDFENYGCQILHNCQSKLKIRLKGRPFETINGIQKKMPEMNIIIAEICMDFYMNEVY
jgi:hypothetical protein